MPSKRFLTIEEQKKLKESFNSDLGVNTISKELKISYNVIQRYWKEWFSKEEFEDRCSRLNRIHKLGTNNPMYGKTGNKHHNAKKGPVLIMGYKAVFAPEWWEGTCHKGSRVYEHILVCCKNLGLTSLPKGYVVHHIDGNILNNSPNNLELLTIGEHMKLHNTTHGKYVKESATTNCKLQEELKRNPS